jgi:hypothetical protein
LEALVLLTNCVCVCVSVFVSVCATLHIIIAEEEWVEVSVCGVVCECVREER